MINIFIILAPQQRLVCRDTGAIALVVCHVNLYAVQVLQTTAAVVSTIIPLP